MNTVSQIQSIVAEKFAVSYMNDSKWHRLLETLCAKQEYLIISYKLIHLEEVKTTIFYQSDFKPFFIEPILYCEIEWIEFPKEHTFKLKRKNNYLKEEFWEQDIDHILNSIKQIGQFQLLEKLDSIKLIAYA
jgi:hypothetical protein